MLVYCIYFLFGYYQFNQSGKELVINLFFLFFFWETTDNVLVCHVKYSSQLTYETYLRIIKKIVPKNKRALFFIIFNIKSTWIPFSRLLISVYVAPAKNSLSIWVLRYCQMGFWLENCWMDLISENLKVRNLHVEEMSILLIHFKNKFFVFK